MSLLKLAKGKVFNWRAANAKARLRARHPDENYDPDDFGLSLRDPSGYYARSYQDFHNILPGALREHREYFGEEQRGFGEDAFHTMWWRLVRKFRPSTFLEIGVYRGQVISLVSLISKLDGIECSVTGISPFSSAGDSVSVYLSNLDYKADTMTNVRHFNLPEPTLVEAYSTDPEALDAIASTQWDMIYIDGNHDYDIVTKDWAACSNALNRGGVIVMDDSGLTTGYRPPPFATAGHPGPSRFASEIDPSEFEEILQVGHNRVFRKR